MNNLNFSLESMTRALRTGKEFTCVPSPNCATQGATEFRFVDKDGRTITYKLTEYEGRGVIERKIDAESFSGLTAPEVDIELLQFYLVASGQPRVFILIQGSAGPDDQTKTDFSLQTMATQRFLAR